jgi:two-component sensor histidine kinase/PAS domain-containing protein
VEPAARFMLFLPLGRKTAAGERRGALSDIDDSARDAPIGDLDFLIGGGKVGALMRAMDWSGSPLGEPSRWPQSLRSVVNLMLNSKFGMFVAWGPELGFLYNDHYAEIAQAKHPGGLGARFQDVWSEIWDEISPLVDQALSGEAVYFEDLPLVINRKGFDEQTWFTFSYSPLRDESGAVVGVFCATHDTTDQVLTRQRIDAERDQLIQMFSQAPTFMALLREPEHRFELANPGYLKLVGHRQVLGRTVAEALPDAVEQGLLDILDTVYRTGEPFAANSYRYAVQAEPGGPVDERFIDVVYQPLKGSDGQVQGVFVEGADVTDRTLAERSAQETQRRLELMVLELNHRVKNNLATVQSIAMQTLRGAERPEEVRESFVQRISALATAHDILTREQWEGATVSNLAHGVLDAFGDGDGRIQLDGPEIQLSSRPALSLSMAFHELATNALKYGALSSPAGEVHLSWELDTSNALRLVWEERGGPAVTPPSRRGFGSRLLERGLAADLGGEVVMDFLPEGLRCRILVRLPQA